MSKLRCDCGAVMGDISRPAKHLFYVTSSDEYEDAGDDGVMLEDRALNWRELWVCETCGIIGIEVNRRFRFFRPANGKQDTIEWLHEHRTNLDEPIETTGEERAPRRLGE